MAQRGHYNNTPRVAVRVVPSYEAEIVAEVGRRTMDVLTVKDALVAPAGTVTLEGTLAAPLLLESVTIAPPAANDTRGVQRQRRESRRRRRRGRYSERS